MLRGVLEPPAGEQARQLGREAGAGGAAAAVADARANQGDAVAEAEGEEDEEEGEEHFELLPWNESNHECALFSSDNDRVCFLSLDPKQLERHIHPHLMDHMKANGIKIYHQRQRRNRRRNQRQSPRQNGPNS